MPQFRYRGINNLTGKPVSGTLFAIDQPDLKARLRKEDVLVTDPKKEGAKKRMTFFGLASNCTV